MFSISENLLLKIFSELDDILRRIFIRQWEDLDQRDLEGPPRGQGRRPGLGPTWTRGWARPCPLGAASAPLDSYKLLFALKMKGR